MKRSAEVRKIFPHWATSTGALYRTNALVRSQCRECGVQLREDTAQLVAIYGAATSLVDVQRPCRMVGCHGPMFYLASVTYGRTWLPLVERADLLMQLELAALPVNAVSLGLGRSARAKRRA